MRYLFAAAIGVCLALSGCSNSAPDTSSQPAATTPAQSTAAPAAAAPAPPQTSAASDASGTPPETIEFQSARDGNVTFTHQKHIDRVNGDCTTCHPKIFSQSREPLNYGKALHRVAEAKRTACAACHAIGGTAFAADSNCPKCHQLRHTRG